MLASLPQLKSISRRSVLPSNVGKALVKRCYSAEEAKEAPQKSLEEVAHLYDTHATVQNQFAYDGM